MKKLFGMIIKKLKRILKKKNDNIYARGEVCAWCGATLTQFKKDDLFRLRRKDELFIVGSNLYVCPKCCCRRERRIQ